jgi:hypothetical protein
MSSQQSTDLPKAPWTGEAKDRIPKTSANPPVNTLKISSNATTPNPTITYPPKTIFPKAPIHPLHFVNLEE